MRVLAGAVAAACVLAAAGCGGGGGGAGRSGAVKSSGRAGGKFEQAADAVCLQASSALAAVTDPNQQVQITLREVDQLRALTPPAATAAAYRDFVDLRARRVAARQAAIKAIDAKDDAAYFRNRREYLRLRPVAYAAAAKAGLVACAGKLPAADSTAIVTLLKREEVHPQASDCSTALTPRFLRQRFNDASTCRRELPRGASGSVVVTPPQGTLPIAVAQLAESGGNAPTRSQEFTLIKSGGQWRIDAIRPLQSGGLTP